MDDFSLSVSELNRNRDRNHNTTAENIFKEFKETKPKFACLHWDSKMVDNVMGGRDDRLAVLVTGYPHHLEGKLLGIVSMKDESGKPTSTGLAQFQNCQTLLEEWDLEENIVCMSFDTTASNTGCRMGASTRLEVKL